MEDMVDMPVGRQDTADYLDLTIETTRRVLTDLKAAGVIDIPSCRQISIRIIKRLQIIAEGVA